MTVQGLISHLMDYPAMMEVYVQTTTTALEKVTGVSMDEHLGIVELKYDENEIDEARLYAFAEGTAR